MLRTRTAWKMAIAGLALAAGCSFEDPNAPPPQDECIADNAGAVEGGLWAIVDGPPACSTTNPARPEGDDTIAFFTGGKWNEGAALCRARDLFLGASGVGNVDCASKQPPDPNCRELTIQKGLSLPTDAPADAIGYCVINKGTPSEIVAYNTCGLQSAGEPACEELLPTQGKADVTAEWFNCPGGALCPAVPEDVCLKTAGDGSGYVMHVNNPDYSCGANSGLSDANDSMLVTTSTGYGRQSAVCLGSSIYDADGNLLFGIGPTGRYRPATSPGIPMIGDGDPRPAGAKGYCLVHEATTFEYALFTLCDDIVMASAPTDGGISESVPVPECPAGAPDRACVCREGEEITPNTKCIRTPKQACEHGVEKTTPRLGKWLACPGSPYCPT